LLSWGRMDYARALIDIRAHRELKEDMIIAIPNMKDDKEVIHTVRVEYEWEPPICGMCMVKPKKPIWKVVYKKNSASSSGMKKNSEVFRKVMSSTNPFDALNMIKEGDESRSYRRLRRSLCYWINDLESQMIKEKLVLLDDEGKPLKPSKPTLPS
ncbi:hypothetical protein Tco_0283827, partial [Tanacetum coccineum]